jgi:hypothetical protein
VNAEGVMEYKQLPKRVRAWWWKNDTGKYNLVECYGARIISLDKSGKTVSNLKMK